MRGEFVITMLALGVVVGCNNSKDDKTGKGKDKNKDGTAKNDTPSGDPAPSAPSGSPAERALCGKRANAIMTAQNGYATDLNQRGYPERYATGVEDRIATAFGETSPSGPRGTADPSRVLAYFLKAGAINAEQLACPGDPFVVMLDPDLSSRQPKSDLHGDGMVEGEPVPTSTLWAKAGSPAATLKGRTFFSYSMQTASQNIFADMSPKMNAKVPVVADRNPFCDSLVKLAGEGPTAKSDGGNSWNHARTGQMVAFGDGHNQWIEDASSVQMPINPAQPNTTFGFDYLYGTNGPTEAAKKPPTDGSCLKAGTRTAEPYTKFGSWLID